MRRIIGEFLEQANQVLFDKDREVRLALACMLARGHLLIEDVPGVGKTTLVHLLARLLNLNFGRVQFTNDLLPSDILGNSIFDPVKQSFNFHPGPIFAQLVLADELNRATPKTQSALLQAMEEREVSIDGKTHRLPHPFFVIATQNPRQQVGTFALPESELDRFLLRITFGYPNRQAEHRLLLGEDRRQVLERLKPVMNAEEFLQMQLQVRGVRVMPPLVNYVQDILDATRSGRYECQGLSPRAGIAIVQSARAWAWIHEKAMVTPEDVQAVAVQAMGHRITGSSLLSPEQGDRLAQEIISAIKIP